MTAPNLENLTTDQLVQLANQRGIDVSDIVGDQASQPSQSVTFPREQLENASTEQLIQLAQQSGINISDIVPTQQQERRSTLDILLGIPTGLVDVVNQSRELGLSGILQGIIDESTSTELSPFEKGIASSLRNVAAPLAGFASDFAEQGIDLLGLGLDQVAQFTGGPSIEELTGVKRQRVPFQTVQLQEFFDEVTDNQFKDTPQEVKMAQNFVKDTLLLGLGGSQSLLRKIGTSLFGNLGASGLVDLGVVSPENEDFAKIGLFLSSAMIRPGQLKETAANKMDKARAAVKGRIFDDNEFVADLKKTRNQLRAVGGKELAHNNEAIKMIDAFLEDVGTGTFKAKNIIKAKENLNAKLSEFEFDPNFNNFKQSFGKVRQDIQKSAERLGKNNPEFINNFNESNEIFNAIFTKNTVANFIENLVPKDIINTLPKELNKFLRGSLRTGTKVVDLPVDFLRRFNKPAVRNAYSNFLINVMEENTPAAIQNLKDLSNEINKDQKQQNR